MAKLIHMSPDEIRTGASKYDNQAEHIAEITQTMTALMNELQADWSGDSQESFVARFEELKPAFERTSELVYDIAHGLRGAANAIEEGSATAAQFFKV